MKSYTQLAQEQRYQIYALMKAGHAQSKIAVILGVHKSTISREIKRNNGQRGYRPRQAHQKALSRRMNKHPSRITRSTWDLVETLINQEWSPEQISHWLKQVKLGIVSHESIYLYIIKDKFCGGTLHEHLRCQKKRRKRYGSYSRRGTIPNRVSIEQRPEIVARKTRIGDWEADTIIGKNHRQALVSLTERKTKLTLLAKVEQKTAVLVSQAIISLLNPIQDRVKTITSDNGKEFSKHENIANRLEADFFFAHPYSSWERGLNENTNGLVRQYFPKSMDFRTITDTMLQNVMEKLNNRPRKTMEYQTPNQVFFGLKSNVALTT